ncbi:CLUMA_CG020830, isoform A [Clunio marinus]|uniref:CLUMA_CG020830, isoform A n=1 Tax=Clunio marinus TaxID=568069 RepID=A0A1J1J8P6_9DIPT|nr:CLUMA_CG020830, isoform A [Clunio marinus]
MRGFPLLAIAVLFVSFSNADVIQKNISFENTAKSRFSCRGRNNGYYADVESGCQTYHLCDVQGRQFTYACPNATLFQQRMTICDHWYMVDCSQSEKFYALDKLTFKKDDSPKLEKHLNVLDETNFENLETQETRNVPSQNFKQLIDPTRVAFSDDISKTLKRSERRDSNINIPATSIEPPKLPFQFNQKAISVEKSKTSSINNQFISQQRKPQSQQQQLSSQTTKKPVVRTFDPDKNYKAFEHIFQPGKKATHKDYDFSRYFTKRISGQATPIPVQRRQDIVQRGSNNPGEIFKTRNNSERFNQQAVKKTTVTTPKPSPVTIKTTTRPVYRTTIPTRNPVPETSTFSRILLPQVNTAKNIFKQANKANLNVKTPERGLLPPKLDNESETQSKHNTRSIADTSFDFNNTQRRSGETKQLLNGSSKKIEYKDLQKLFSIPAFVFPIELNGRDGYENAEAVNSFQVKIPYKKGNTERYYYLEHEHCNPECHPYFFRPRSCEPCVKL